MPPTDPNDPTPTPDNPHPTPVSPDGPVEIPERRDPISNPADPTPQREPVQIPADSPIEFPSNPTNPAPVAMGCGNCESSRSDQ
jgi:hypothetical protein